jgi:hypothetical protein
VNDNKYFSLHYQLCKGRYDTFYANSVIFPQYIKFNGIPERFKNAESFIQCSVERDENFNNLGYSFVTLPDFRIKATGTQNPIEIFAKKPVLPFGEVEINVDIKIVSVCIDIHPFMQYTTTP